MYETHENVTDGFSLDDRIIETSDGSRRHRSAGHVCFFVGAGGDGGNRSVIHNTLIARSCLQGDYETFQMKENVFNAASRARYPSLHTDVDQIGSNMKSCLNVPPYSVHHHIM
jgi:hypothetical protein